MASAALAPRRSCHSSRKNSEDRFLSMSARAFLEIYSPRAQGAGRLSERPGECEECGLSPCPAVCFCFPTVGLMSSTAKSSVLFF